jgi:hypothetical protein
MTSASSIWSGCVGTRFKSFVHWDTSAAYIPLGTYLNGLSSYYLILFQYFCRSIPVWMENWGYPWIATLLYCNWCIVSLAYMYVRYFFIIQKIKTKYYLLKHLSSWRTIFTGGLVLIRTSNKSHVNIFWRKNHQKLSGYNSYHVAS